MTPMDLATIIQITQIVMICVGGIVALITLRNTIRSFRDSLNATNTAAKDQFASIQQSSKEQFASVQAELKELGKILIDQARFDEKLTNLDKRVTAQGRKIDELARGDGYVKQPPRQGIDGEYP
jgi:predicted negative regulator of RcsB-dependent stress response